MGGVVVWRGLVTRSGPRVWVSKQLSLKVIFCYFGFSKIQASLPDKNMSCNSFVLQVFLFSINPRKYSIPGSKHESHSLRVIAREVDDDDEHKS